MSKKHTGILEEGKQYLRAQRNQKLGHWDKPYTVMCEDKVEEAVGKRGWHYTYFMKNCKPHTGMMGQLCCTWLTESWVISRSRLSDINGNKRRSLPCPVAEALCQGRS